VNNEFDRFFPATPVDVFARQMEHVARRYHVCALDEAVERLKQRELPENAVAITFDDGYRDNFLQAFPITQSLSLPMTIFLATDAIGTGHTLWHDRVFSAFRDTDAAILEGFDPIVDGASLGTPDDRIRIMTRILHGLRQLNENGRNKRITEMCEALGVLERTSDADLMLRWEDVREMSLGKVSFGSHTASHPILSRLSREETVEQVTRSCAAIQRHLGKRPTLFAYPNGSKADFSSVTKTVLMECGFKCAVTTEFGVNEPHQDVFELRRGRPWEEHLPTFAFKLGWYRLMSPRAV
jgi:peptidoglycan/xylan/chitin deacetylase (PgdA/CDA1 family)